MDIAVLETYSNKKLTNLEQKIHKQIIQTQKEFDTLKLKAEKKIKNLQSDLVEVQKAKIKIHQKQIAQTELKPTKKCLESLASETAIITPANEPTDILKAIKEAKEAGLIPNA
ncbi:hypothetical protein ACWIWK_03650 [Helicobacter sp. 23-1048]